MDLYGVLSVHLLQCLYSVLPEHPQPVLFGHHRSVLLRHCVAWKELCFETFWWLLTPKGPLLTSSLIERVAVLKAAPTSALVGTAASKKMALNTKLRTLSTNTPPPPTSPWPFFQNWVQIVYHTSDDIYVCNVDYSVTWCYLYNLRCMYLDELI